MNNYGDYMYSLAKELFPICRSLTGNGVRQTLAIIKREIPELCIYEIPTGTQVFDWTIPKEWNIRDAWVKDPAGKKIIDFKDCNLHVMGYSSPVHKKIKFDELLSILYTQEDQPDFIPYVTSYYKERYGFCCTEKSKQNFLNSYNSDSEFEIFIDSSLTEGSLTYGEVVIPNTVGTEEKEIFFSTYVCHPSMANNELSGPCLATALIKSVKEMKERRYSYRFIFIPENIGATAYLSQNYKHLQRTMLAGFNLTCVGDDRTYSYLASAYGNTLADKVLKNVLSFHYPHYKSYSFLKSGSDERRYNAAGIDLPVVCFCRSLYGEYPEYHTSGDDLSLISSSGLQGSFEVMEKCIFALENNRRYKIKTLTEPQLGKRGLYPTVSKKNTYDEVYDLMNIIAYMNGKNDIFDISDYTNVSVERILENINKLKVLVEIV